MRTALTTAVKSAAAQPVRRETAWGCSRGAAAGASTTNPTEHEVVHYVKTLAKMKEKIVEYLKPTHTHFVDPVEPLPPTVPNYWELGFSDLAETTDLH